MNPLLGPNYLNTLDREDLTHRETVKLPTGSCPQAHSKLWFQSLKQTASFCPHHHRTRLLPVPPHLPPQRVRLISQRFFADPIQYEPDTYDFIARLTCPACHCARANFPPEFIETTFADFITDTAPRRAALAKAMALAEHLRKGQAAFGLFVGRAGLGKTRLACNLVHSLRHRDALYLTQARFRQAFRQFYDRKPVECDETRNLETQADLLDFLQSLGLLILDELGVTPLAPGDEWPLLDSLLKYRYDQRKPTLLISNLPLSGDDHDETGVKQYLGDALWDRLKAATHRGKFMHQFIGESYRSSADFNFGPASPP